MSIKRADVGATFDPEISIQALVTSSYFLLRMQKRLRTHSLHTVNTPKYTQRERPFTRSRNKKKKKKIIMVNN